MTTISLIELASGRQFLRLECDGTGTQADRCVDVALSTVVAYIDYVECNLPQGITADLTAVDNGVSEAEHFKALVSKEGQ